MVQAGSNDALINKELENEINAYAANNKPQATINKIGAIMEARVNLGHNAAPLLTVEALMCVLARYPNSKHHLQPPRLLSRSKHHIGSEVNNELCWI